MTSKQRLVKYFAIALAVFIIVNIALLAFSFLSALIDIEKLPENKREYTNSYAFDSSISEIELNVAFADIEVINGEDYYFATNNENITYHRDGNKITVDDKFRIFDFENTKKLIVCIPKTKEYDEITVNSGAGDFDAEVINVKKFIFNKSIGEADFDCLVVSENARINGVICEISIKSGAIHNLDSFFPVGEVKYKCDLFGKNKIRSAIGEIDVILPKPRTEYKFQLGNGITECKMNSEVIEKNKTYGSSESQILLKALIGEIEIKTNG